MRPTILAVLTVLTVLSDVSFSRTTVTNTNENNEVISVTSSRSAGSSRRSRTTTQSNFRFPTESVTRRPTNRRGSSVDSDIRFPDDDNQRLQMNITTPRSTIERNRTITNSIRALSTANPRTRTTTRSSVRNTISVSSVTPNVRSRSSTVASTRRRSTTSSRRHSTTTPTSTIPNYTFPNPYEVLERLNETSNANITGYDLFDSNHCPDGYLYDRATRSCRRTFNDF